MSTNKTQNLNLHAWEPTDPFRREEFNENFAAIDALLTRMAVGTYVGTGEYGQQKPTVLTFDFTPKLLLLYFANQAGATPSYGMLPAIVLWGYTATLYADGSSSNFSCTVTYQENSIRFFNRESAQAQFNTSGRTYYYCAIG